MLSQPPRVLLIHSIPTPYRLPLFRRLAALPDIELTVMFMSASAKNRVWRQDNFGLPRAKVLPGTTINLRSGGDTFPIWVNPTVPLEIFRGSFDIVICAGWDSITTFLARLACALMGIPFILWAGSTPMEKSWRRSIAFWPVTLLVRSAKACIAYGTAAKSYLCSLGAKQVFISYNTVDVETFDEKTREPRSKRDELKRELGIDQKRVVIYVGQLIERKGVLTLANAMDRLSRGVDTAMVWVGYGPLRVRLEQRARSDQKVKHYFASAQTVDELCRYYAVADVSVLPSNEEVWGLVVNESLASGVPVVTTSAVGSGPDLIKEGWNGFIVPPGDEHALADCLARVLSDGAQLATMSQNARNSMRDYTYDQNVNAWRNAVTAAMRRP